MNTNAGFTRTYTEYLFVSLFIYYYYEPGLYRDPNTSDTKPPLLTLCKGPGFTAVGAGAVCQSQFKVHEISMSIDCSRGERRGRRGGGEGARWVLVTPLIDQVSCFEFLSSLGPLCCRQLDMLRSVCAKSYCQSAEITQV